MKKKKFDYLDESLMMLKYLFPNEKLLSDVIKANEKFASRLLRLVIVFSLYLSSVFFISLELDESIRYIFGTSLIYLGLVLLDYQYYIFIKSEG